jgi:alpha-tubulin suppressor-like RCC1 family protein
LAIRANGSSAWGWGHDQYGQLGDNVSGTGNNKTSPIEITGLP